jgi:Uma2 family endonuclease
MLGSPIQVGPKENRMTVELLDPPVSADEQEEALEPRVEIHDREGCEFVNGEWVVKTMSSKSDRVAVRLISVLETFVEERKLGLVFGSETGYQIFGDEKKRVRKPDVSFIRSGVLPDDTAPDGHLFVPPDFVVEVISPNDESISMNEKLIDYLRAGVKLIWVVYPKTRYVEIIRRNGTANWLFGAGTLTGEEIIPGFEISFESLFRGA